MIWRRAVVFAPPIAHVPVLVERVPGLWSVVTQRRMPPPFVAVSGVQVRGEPAVSQVADPVGIHTGDLVTLCIEERQPEAAKVGGASKNTDG